MRFHAYSLSKIQMEHGANQNFVPSTRALARIQKYALPVPSLARTRSEVDSRLAEPPRRASFGGPDRGGQHHGFLRHGTACSAWQTADELSLSPARTGEQPDRDAATSVASVGVWPGIFLFLSNAGCGSCTHRANG
jgi:hypothetical protein